MKSVPIAIILLLGLSFGYVTTDTNKGSTVVDYLKDGFDAVYKFKEHSVFSYHKLKEFEGQTFDVHLRKSSSQDDPKKFVMHLENVQLQGKHDEPLTDIDLEALVLPVIVAVQNEDLDIGQVYATTADTKKSLNWKHDALILLLHNMTEQVAEFGEMAGMNSIAVEMDMDKMAFGNCKIDFAIKQKKGTIGFEISTTRDRCTGELDKGLTEEFTKYDVTDINGTSEIKLGFYYNKVTGQFLRSFLKMKGKTVSEHDYLIFSMGMELHFDSFKEIQENFDETKNTKMYKESDIE